MKQGNNTDIGYTLHKDIGYTCEEYCAVSVKVKVRDGGTKSFALWRPSPKGCREAARPERSEGLSWKDVLHQFIHIGLEALGS